MAPPSPSLPHPNPCLSYWHQTTRANPLITHNSTLPPPPTTKHLIIGSGLSGALTAYTLLTTGTPPSDILLLEAREAVSGATGRNAGHVRPDAFRGFAAYSRIHGVPQAKKIIDNEKVVLERLAAFVEEKGVDCDFELSSTFDVCLTEEFAGCERGSLEGFGRAGGDVAHVRVWEGEEARRRTGVRGAVAAYEWPAGSLHPAKLAFWLLGRVVEAGGGLWTYCPAVRVRKGEGKFKWVVETERGVIEAENVVHCTNAYAAYLLPELSGFVTPNRAQAHSVVPSSKLSGANALTSTMSLRYSLHHFFSLIQRRVDGTIIWGVSRKNPGWSQKTQDEIVSFDDSQHNEEISHSAAKAFTKLFPDDTKRQGEGLDYSWSGIIGMTPDSVPLVGPIDGLEGQWICAGFNGHGMARIWTSAPGLVKLMNGQDWSATGLPECFRYSRERLERKPVGSVW